MLVFYFMEEIWKAIPGYDGYYEVSNLGRVKSLARKAKIHVGAFRPVAERIMKLHVNSVGYQALRLKKEGSKLWLVHRLVLLAFVGASDLKIDHINMVKTDNRLENLEYVTDRENLHRYRKSLTRILPMGVYQYGNKFQATIKKKGKTYNLGTYDNAVDASNIYQIALNDLDNVEKYTKVRSKSQYGSGVYKTKYGFCAKISVNGKNKYIGRFETPEAANTAIESFKSMKIFV
jgi:hypothetical protein